MDAAGYRTEYRYDAAGNRTALTDAKGQLFSYTYNALNRLTAATTGAGVSEYAYDRSGRKKSVRYPNGTTIAYEYDGAGRLSRLTNQTGGTVLSRYDYLLDENGNRLSQVEQNGGEAQTTTYAYDGNDRLTAVNYPDKAVSYEYDAAYNRTRETTKDAEGQILADKTYTYNTRNQLTGIEDSANPAGAVTYQYDANGNRTVKSKNGTVTTFIYDVRDQLTTVRQDATTLGAFRYDYRGLRIGKRGEDGETKYVYDGDSVLLQTDAEGNSLAKYDYGPDQLLSLTHKTEGRQFYHFDGLGSVANLTNGEGGLQARYQYDAWGNIRQEAGASANIFGFTGHERDKETGLYYFKARFYDPDTGRFLSQDSYLGEIDTAPSLHRYLYAYSNPTVYRDPTGHAPCFSNYAGGCGGGVTDDRPSREEVERQMREGHHDVGAFEYDRKIRGEPVEEKPADDSLSAKVRDAVEKGYSLLEEDESAPESQHYTDRNIGKMKQQAKDAVKSLLPPKEEVDAAIDSGPVGVGILITKEAVERTPAGKIAEKIKKKVFGKKSKLSGKNPPINEPRQKLHTDGAEGKSQFKESVDADAVVEDAWANGTPKFNKNGKLIGKVKEYADEVGTEGQKSVDTRFSRKHGVHGFPSRKKEKD